MFGWKSKKRDKETSDNYANELQESVLKALSYGDLDDRLNAIRVVSTAGESAIGILVKTLGDECWIVRRNASNFLSRLGKTAVPALISAFNDKRPEVHNEVFHALIMMGPGILDLLYPALTDGNPLIRAGVIETIGEQRSSVSLQYLINISRDPDPDVRRETARALGKTAGKDAVITLLALLHDPDGSVCSSAADALLLREDATEQLLKALADSDKNVRRKSSDLLTRGGLPVLPMLLHATGDNNPDIREGAVTVLGRIATPDAITALIVSLEDHEAGVRNEAVTALVKIGEKAINPLAEAIRSDSIPLRNGAMESLSRIGPSAVPALITLTRDNNPVVRKISCSILGETGDKSAEPALNAALNDEVVSVRREAFESLEVLRRKINS